MSRAKKKTGIKLNPQLDGFLQKGLLSEAKIRELDFLKEFIDRLSGNFYVDPEQQNELKAKYGVLPDIITWGDYFQTEVATQFARKTDAQFHNVIQTIVYDIISAAIIFSKKDAAFLEQVNMERFVAWGNENKDSQENQEAHCLGVLLDYYREMDIKTERLTAEDFSFFEQYNFDVEAS